MRMRVRVRVRVRMRMPAREGRMNIVEVGSPGLSEDEDERECREA